MKPSCLLIVVCLGVSSCSSSASSTSTTSLTSSISTSSIQQNTNSRNIRSPEPLPRNTGNNLQLNSSLVRNLLHRKHSLNNLFFPLFNPSISYLPPYPRKV